MIKNAIFTEHEKFWSQLYQFKLFDDILELRSSSFLNHQTIKDDLKKSVKLIYKSCNSCFIFNLK